jgi:hypothetical protein
MESYHGPHGETDTVFSIGDSAVNNTDHVPGLLELTLFSERLDQPSDYQLYMEDTAKEKHAASVRAETVLASSLGYTGFSTKTEGSMNSDLLVSFLFWQYWDLNSRSHTG